MPQRLLHIPDHLIVPFGSAKRYQNDRIRMVSVGARGVYFKTDLPVIYINKRMQGRLQLCDIGDHMPRTETDFLTVTKVGEALDLLDLCEEKIKEFQPSPTRFERDFITLFFDLVKDLFSIDLLRYNGDTDIDDLSPLWKQRIYRIFNVLLPIPEMQIYVHDPLTSEMNFEPDNNFRVDFGFWNGRNIIAVEIDGMPPPDKFKQEYIRDKQRDRMLRRANIDLVHILNNELDRFGKQAINALLPREIFKIEEKTVEKLPFDPIPF